MHQESPRLGVRAGPDHLAGFDAVIVATGSTPRPSSVPVEGGRVLTPHEALAARDEDWTARRVVVVDEVGHFPAYLPAEVLADAGARVVVSTGKLSHGSALDSATAMTMHTRLARKDVEFLVHAAATALVDGAVRFRDTLSGIEFERPADAVVVACGNTASAELAHRLTGPVKTVGDATAPRTITEAVREGYLVGREI